MTPKPDPLALWLSTLAGLLNPMFPGDVSGALALLRPHLRGFGPEAFTPQTARDVAAARRFGQVPSWDVIEPILRAAVRDARPVTFGRLPAPREPDREPPGPEALARVLDRVAECRRVLSQPGAEPLVPLRSVLRDVSLSREKIALVRRTLP